MHSHNKITLWDYSEVKYRFKTTTRNSLVAMILFLKSDLCIVITGNTSIYNGLEKTVNLKGILLCSFTKSCFCFGGVLEHILSCLVVQKSHYFSHNLHYYNISLPSLTQMAPLVLGLMKARLPKTKMGCDWLAVPVRCDWHFSIAPPLARTACSSILPYQFRSWENLTRGSCRTFARTDISRHIKVVMLLLLLFLAKSRFR